MAGIGNQMKLALLKGMEAIGKSASGMANSAQQKLAEINLDTRRREILSDFPMRAFDLWQKGTELPEPLSTMLSELNDLDERLGLLRAQRFAKVENKSKDASSTVVSDNVEATDEEMTDEESSPVEEQDQACVQDDSQDPACVQDDSQDQACENQNEASTGNNA